MLTAIWKAVITSESTSTSETTTTVPQTGDSNWMFVFMATALCAAALMLSTYPKKKV